MRPNANSRRTRGRGGRKSGNSCNQTFDSNGPGARVRGNASQIYEKYQQLARDAASSGDRVGAENFLQHAEHYYRLMSANAAKNEQRNAQDESARENAGSNEAGEEAQASVETPSAEEADNAEEAQSDNGSRANGRKRRSRKSNGSSSESFADKLDGEPEVAAADESDAAGDDGETASA